MYLHCVHSCAVLWSTLMASGTSMLPSLAYTSIRSVHRRVLTACGLPVSPMRTKLSCSVRRQVLTASGSSGSSYKARDLFRSVHRRVLLTASGSSVSSLHVRLSCTVHRQVQTPGLACTVRRAMPCLPRGLTMLFRALPVCSLPLSLTLSVVLLRSSLSWLLLFYIHNHRRG